MLAALQSSLRRTAGLYARSLRQHGAGVEAVCTETTTQVGTCFSTIPHLSVSSPSLSWAARSFMAAASSSTATRGAAGAAGAAASPPSSSSSSTAPGLQQQQQQRRLAHSEPSASVQQYTDEQIDEIRSRIFGTHIGDGLPSGRKVLRKKLVGDKIASYYPEWITGKQDPLWVDLKMERQKQKLGQLRRRGKGPPAKGAGKRSGKKK